MAAAAEPLAVGRDQGAVVDMSGSAQPVDTVRGPEPSPGGPRTEAAPDAAAREAQSWSSLWQAPAIVLSLILIALGVATSMHDAPESDFDGALDDVDHLLAEGELDAARVKLRDVIRPHLQEATDLQRGRFHAAVGDWLDATQQAAAVHDGTLDTLIARGYEQAERLSFTLSPAQRERWAEAAIASGDLETATQRFEELEAMSLVQGAEGSLRQRRNRVLRRLVEARLASTTIDGPALSSALEDYRRDGLLGISDEMWAIARQAELRLEEGRAREAVERLLIEMRRLEPRGAEAPRASFGELYLLLGRGYEQMGQLDEARFNLDRALRLFEGQEAAVADVLELQGRIELAEGRHIEAMEKFDRVASEFVGTPAHLPALLGRAQTAAMLGDQPTSIDEYRTLQALLATGAPSKRLTPEHVAATLIDRYDVALLAGRLGEALQFLEIAANLFPRRETPAPVLQRLASGHRQMAENRLAAGDSPAARAEAADQFLLASDYAIQFARAIVGLPEADEEWANALWLAADSADRSGATPRAIDLFTEYVAGRPDDDLRRPEALYRLGQAYAADGQHELAVETYRRLLSSHGSSLPAYASYVPLARAYVALDRRPEAEQMLLAVLSGHASLQPAAAEYRAALIELGRLYHESGAHVKAIERLNEAVQRAPQAEGIDEVRFWLADSHRQEAMGLRDRVAREPTLSPEESRALSARAEDGLRSAADLFDAVKQGMGARGDERLDRVERDIVRLSHLYHADCEFLLGDYRRAIELYEQAAGRYASDPSAMHALVQLVNCYHALGDQPRAAAAHQRALARLQQLPESAFESPAALMNREAWERWLSNDPVGVAMGGET